MFLDGDRWVHFDEERRVSAAAWEAVFHYPDGRTHRLRYEDSAIVRLAEDARVNAADCPVLNCALSAVSWQPLMRDARLWRIRLEDPERSSGARLAALWSSDPRVEYAVPEFHLEHRSYGYTVDDPLAPDQWYLGTLDLAEAWAIESGDPSVSIAVVDNGCDFDHPDLSFVGGLDLVDEDDDPSHPVGADNGHGTACAGLAAADTNNGTGIAGACPECTMSCVRLLTDDDSPVPLGADVEAFDFALRSGAAVVSNSWGFASAIPVPSPLRDAINTVFDRGRDGRGAVVVFAAGNDGRTVGDDELLSVRGVLGVGAVNQFDETTSFSNRGAAVDLVAPVGTLTTDITGPDGFDASDYTNSFGGTSSACPIAVGIAGLVVSAHPEWSSAEVVEHLLGTARPAPLAIPDAFGRDPLFGAGVIDPVAALGPVEEPSDEPPESSGCRQAGLALCLPACLRRRRHRAP